MPLSRQDAARALRLLEDFIGKLDAETEPEHVEALARAIDVLRSSLFTSLIDIQQSYVEDVSTFDSTWDVHNKGDAVGFCRRYGISLGSLRSYLAADSTTIPKENGSHRIRSHDNADDPDDDLPLQWDSFHTDPVLAKARALLDESNDVVAPLEDKRERQKSGGATSPSFLDELTTKTAQRRSTLDENALTAETSFITTTSSQKRENGDVSSRTESNSNARTQRADSLLFMRNKQSMTRFEQSAESRSQRTVSLTKGSEGLGMSIVGTATTGVFVSMLVSGGYAERDGRLKKGDQILSINGITMEKKSYTDAASVIKQISAGGNVDFVLTSNPAVFAEYERVAAQRAK
ncbi:disks large homolog 1-like [Oscarella lobularis]|uniref:disks large homolog 1-like n=1 Tax=Oscarella lobularis TaxID=121494 RepID=UPI0033138ED5